LRGLNSRFEIKGNVPVEFKKLLQKRRSVRKFQNKNVPVALIEEIITDSTKAPNAGNNQPWKFIIISDKKVIKEMSDVSKASILADIAKDPISPLKIYEKPLQNPCFNVFYNAPCLVCIVGKTGLPTITVDCALAGSYLMLSAASRGLGTCWVELGKEIKDPSLLEKIRMPENHEIYAPIIVGYPEKILPMPKRKKPKIIVCVKSPI
jgi:nitroreductase